MAVPSAPITTRIRQITSRQFFSLWISLTYPSTIKRITSGIDKVIRTVANSNINEVYGLARLKIIDLASKGEKKPVQKFIKIYKNSYFKKVILGIKKVQRLSKQNHTIVCSKLGKACSDPGNFLSAIHCIITTNNFKQAIIKTIKGAGCNASRSNFVGAYFSALNGIKGIPNSWIKKTLPAKNIIKIYKKI